MENIRIKLNWLTVSKGLNSWGYYALGITKFNNYLGRNGVVLSILFFTLSITYDVK